MNPTKRARTSPSVSVCGLRLDPYGLGTLPLGIEYPEPEKRPSRSAALALLHTAFRSGVQLLDTADSYCAGPGGSAEASAPHYVESLISDAIRTYTGDSTNIRVCTKGGMRRVDSSSKGWRPKGCTAPIVRRMILDSHAALGGKRPIDIYMLHHTDTLSTHQLEDALKEMQAAVDEGLVLCLGLANATVAHIEVAVRLRIDLAVVQNQYSLWHRDPELPRPRDGDSKNKRGVVNFCASLGIAFMPYGVFGGVRSRDGRLSLRQSFPQLVEMARQKNTSPETIVLAWMRHRFPHILHIPGARSRQHVLDCAVARNVCLTEYEVNHISELKPVACPNLGADVSLACPHFLHLEKGALSGSSQQLLLDFKDDIQKTEVETGVEITWTQDTISLSGRTDKRAAAVAILDEILRFYTGQGLLT